MTFTGFDIFLSLLILFCAVRCALRGFVAEMMSLAAVIGGLAAALIFTSSATPIIERYLGESFWNPIIAFLILFLLCYIVVKLFESSLYRIIERVSLEKLDQSLGFFLGVAEGLLVAALLIFIMDIQPVIDFSRILQGSFFADFLRILFPIGSQLFSRGVRLNRV